MVPSVVRMRLVVFALVFVFDTVEEKEVRDRQFFGALDRFARQRHVPGIGRGDRFQRL